MHKNIAGTLDRADELYKELMTEYDRSLLAQSVSDRAVQLTHEVTGALRSVLDRTARRYWDQHIAPSLSETDRDNAKIYFPITASQHGFDSMMGKWKWKTVRADHEAIYIFLLALQPFINQANKWLAVVDDLAINGKHIDLVPQTRTERRETTVTGEHGGRVSWGGNRLAFGPGGSVGLGPGGRISFGSGGVQFSGNVSAVGAPIDPATQRTVPTPGVTEEIVTWVSFIIADHNVNATDFCKRACEKTRQIATEMSDQFGL